MKVYLQEKPLSVLYQQGEKPSKDVEVMMLNQVYISVEQVRNMALIANMETGELSWVSVTVLWADFSETPVIAKK